VVVVVVRDHLHLHLQRRPIDNRPTCLRRKRRRSTRNDIMMLSLERGQVEVLNGPTRLRMECHGLPSPQLRRRNYRGNGTKKLLVESGLRMQDQYLLEPYLHHHIQTAHPPQHQSATLFHTTLSMEINLQKEAPVPENYPIKKQ
jgi:hypothetical protein